MTPFNASAEVMVKIQKKEIFSLHIPFSGKKICTEAYFLSGKAEEMPPVRPSRLFDPNSDCPPLFFTNRTKNLDEQTKSPHCFCTETFFFLILQSYKDPHMRLPVHPVFVTGSREAYPEGRFFLPRRNNIRLVIKIKKYVFITNFNLQFQINSHIKCLKKVSTDSAHK